MKKIFPYLISLVSLILLYNCVGFRYPTEPIKQAKEINIPDFPWPPPRPSAFVEIPKIFFSTCIDLYDVDQILREALDLCDYTERSYYRVPNGFAIVTRIEQINIDATSKVPPARWSVEPEIYSEFNLASYIRAIFFSDPGFFRVFTIIVSNQPFRASEKSLTEGEAMTLLNQGLNTLPSELGNLLKSKETFCTVLIYEFEKPEEKDTSYVVLPGKHIGAIHLEKSLIQKQIKRIHEHRNGAR